MSTMRTLIVVVGLFTVGTLTAAANTTQETTEEMETRHLCERVCWMFRDDCTSEIGLWETAKWVYFGGDDPWDACAAEYEDCVADCVAAN